MPSKCLEGMKSYLTFVYQDLAQRPVMVKEFRGGGGVCVCVCACDNVCVYVRAHV